MAFDGHVTELDNKHNIATPVMGTASRESPGAPQTAAVQVQRKGSAGIVTGVPENSSGGSSGAMEAAGEAARARNLSVIRPLRAS